MKTRLLSLLAWGWLAPIGFAAQFDAKSFGASLNGWDQNQIASYSLEKSNYQTHRPIVSATSGGGMQLSTRVDLIHNGRITAASDLRLNFDSAGILISAQIQSKIAGKTIDTARIERPQVSPSADPDPTTTVSDSGAVTREMVDQLIAALDHEIENSRSETQRDRKDLLSRIFHREAIDADLSAGLRRNVELILQSIGG